MIEVGQLRRVTRRTLSRSIWDGGKIELGTKLLVLADENRFVAVAWNDQQEYFSRSWITRCTRPL